MIRALASRRLELVLALLVVVLDQLTKAGVRTSFELYETMSVIPGFLNLTRVHNTGAAFGMLGSVEFPFKPVVLTAVGVLALVGIAWYISVVPEHERLTRAGVACIAGGAIGNLIDRVRAGYVLDFVDAYWSGWHFWAFNVADAAITVGVGLMILDMLRVGRRVPDTV
ncbi:MAG: signal peptidase II [Vicinamibacterales bacterium]